MGGGSRAKRYEEVNNIRQYAIMYVIETLKHGYLEDTNLYTSCLSERQISTNW